MMFDVGRVRKVVIFRYVAFIFFITAFIPIWLRLLANPLWQIYSLLCIIAFGVSLIVECKESRCPNCHRYISYRLLLKSAKNPVNCPKCTQQISPDNGVSGGRGY